MPKWCYIRKYKSSTNTLTITRNPYGFYSIKDNKLYKGVKFGEEGNVDNATFIQLVTDVLADNEITIIPASMEVTKYYCLPDTLDDFSSEFIDVTKSTTQNMIKFKSRILGLVSYFPDIDALLPNYNKKTDLHIINIPMSNFQFSVYEEARSEERKVEKNNAKKRARQTNGGGAAGELYEDSSSTYRIFSRAFCNFVFPRPDDIPELRRPLPREGKKLSDIIVETASEDLIDAISVEEKVKNAQENDDLDKISEISSSDAVQQIQSYERRTKIALEKLDEYKDLYLTPEALEIYSPKFLNILSRVLDKMYKGLHLIYSHFRTLEGVGILSLILKANGFAQFKIAKRGADWILDMPLEDMSKPKYVLYTGTEKVDEKEVIRNIFNSNWFF